MPCFLPKPQGTESWPPEPMYSAGHMEQVRGISRYRPLPCQFGLESHIKMGKVAGRGAWPARMLRKGGGHTACGSSEGVLWVPGAGHLACRRKACVGWSSFQMKEVLVRKGRRAGVVMLSTHGISADRGKVCKMRLWV